MRPLLIAAALMLSGLSAAPLAAAQTPAAETLPFRIDAPTGFEVKARPRGPDFDVYDVLKGDVGYVGIYLGCCASFPIKEGVRVESRPGGLKVALRGDRVVEYLWPGQIHVWVREGDGIDPVIADRIAASVRPAP